MLTGRQRALDVPLAGKPRGPLRPEPERGLPVEHVLLAVERHAAERLAGRQPVEADPGIVGGDTRRRSEEHTSELQSLMRISYAVFCLKKKNYTYLPSLNHYDYTI